MNLLVEDGLDAEVQAQAEQICGTYLGTSDFYTSSKTQRALDRERLTDATMLIVYSLTALFGIIGISSAAVAILIREERNLPCCVLWGWIEKVLTVCCI